MEFLGEEKPTPDAKIQKSTSENIGKKRIPRESHFLVMGSVPQCSGRHSQPKITIKAL